MRFQIVIIGHPHAAAFAEIAETLVFGLRALGHTASAGINAFIADGVNIVLGMHMLPESEILHLPPQTVMYNLEQVEDSLFEWAPQLETALRRFEVWDYSPRNLERLGDLAPRRHLLPIGTMPQLTRIKPAAKQDIDVLFYGVVNERRRVVLKAIQDRGLIVSAMFNCYGAARDALIARAKLVVNLHKHEAQVFEVVRVSYLLANRKAVVAEISPQTAIDADLTGAVAGAARDDIAEVCHRLVHDRAARQALERRGYRAMSARRESDLLKVLLDQRANMTGAS